MSQGPKHEDGAVGRAGVHWRSGCIVASLFCVGAAIGMLWYMGVLHGELVMQVARREPYEETLSLFNGIQFVAPALGLLAVCLATAARQNNEPALARRFRQVSVAGGVLVILLSFVFPM
jgi:hypothetical protein